MIIAHKWHSIARTTTIGASTGIRVEFGESFKILLTTSIDWGNAVISVQNSNLNNTIVASVRLRQNGIHYYLDLKVSQSFSTDFKIELYDNTYWEESSGVSDLAGATLCIIDDINSINTPSSYGESFFEEDENGDLVPKPKADGSPRGIWTNSFMSSGGRNTTNPGEGGGISYFEIVFENDLDTKYSLNDGVVTLPAYPVVPDVSGFILKTTADKLYQPKGNYLTSIPSEYITETELSNALSPYLSSQTAAETYATIIALDTHITDYTEFKTNTNKRLLSLEDMFEWDDDGHIKAKAGLYTDSFLSSGGKNTSGGSGGVDVDLSDYLTKIEASSTYLPLSGGTISGGYSPLTINRNDGITSYITFSNYSKVLGYLGFEEDGPAYTTTNWEIHRLIHSGNIGSYALPLSGGRIEGNNDMLHLNGANNTYILFELGYLAKASVGYYNNFAYVANETTYARIGIADDGTPQYWTDYTGNTKHTLIHSGNISSQSVNYATSAGNANSLNGISSGNYAYYNPDANGAYLAFNINDYSFTQYGQGDKYIEYYDKGAYYNSVWGWVMAIHGFKGNADSATKLQTARTIWGQSFDGSGDVTAPAKMQYLEFANVGGNVIGYVGKGANSEDTLYIGTYGDSNVYLFSHYISSSVILKPSGNVLIGTTTDNGYRMQVAGSVFANDTVYARGQIYCDNWFRTYNSTGWYNEMHGGGIYMEDSNFVKTYGSKGFSSDFFNTGWGREARLPSTGRNWYRVAVGSTYGVNIILSIGKNFYYIGPDSAVFSISIGYNTSASAITLLSKNQNFRNFSSIRVVALSDISYAIEVYLYNDVANTDSWRVSGVSMGDWVFQAPVLSDGSGTVTGQLGFDYHTTMATNGNAFISGAIDAAVFTSSNETSSGTNTTGLFRWGRFDEKTGGFKSQFGGYDCKWEIIDKEWSKALFAFSSSGNFTASGNIDSYSTGDYSGVIGLNRKSPTGGLYNTSYNGWQIHNYRGTLQFFAESPNGSSGTKAYLDNDGNLFTIGECATSKRFVVSAGYNATNPTEQAIVINSADGASSYAGWPGIGFHIPGITYATIKLGSDSHFYFFNYNLAYLVPIKCGGVVAEGNISASGDITAFQSSDARLKENITTIPDDRAIDILLRLNPVTFDWNDTATSLSARLKGQSQGFIAQEWETIIPNASGTMWDKYKGIDYIQTIPYLTKGWQIHETELQKLKREVQELKDKLQRYESIYN